MLAKLSLGINALLIIAVTFLFLRKPDTQEAEVVTQPKLPVNSEFSKPEGESAKAPVMAYVNGDVLNEKYDYIKDRIKTLEQKYKAADEKVRKEYQKRQAEVDELVAYAQGGKATDEELMIAQNRLQQLQMEMDQIQQKESENVMKKEAEMQKDLQSRVQKFLETYAASKGIDYVVNYQPSTQFILYGSEAYDITNEVVNGLNQEYQQEKAGNK